MLTIKQEASLGEDVLDVVMTFIREYMTPEDVFDEATLSGWAIDNDFSKPEE